jgi:hypothetical protein
MATTAEIRSWLRDQGETVPDKGRLNPALVAMYDQAHPAAPSDDDTEWDLDAPAEILDVEDLEPDVPMTPERRPRTKKTGRAEQRAKTPFTSRLLGSKPAEGRKPPRKVTGRISLEKFTTRMYSSLGRMVRPLSVPMSNCLQAQAAMAGVLLEDMVKHTTLDRILQPAARAEDKLDKGIALVAPPLLTLAIEQSFQLPPDQMMVRQAVLMPMLRESLRIGMEVSQSFAEQIKTRIEQDAKWDREIDDMIALIFAQPQATVVPEPEMAGV